MALGVKLKRVAQLEANVFVPSTRTVGGAKLDVLQVTLGRCVLDLACFPLTRGVSGVAPSKAEVHQGSVGRHGHTTRVGPVPLSSHHVSIGGCRADGAPTSEE